VTVAAPCAGHDARSSLEQTTRVFEGGRTIPTVTYWSTSRMVLPPIFLDSYPGSPPDESPAVSGMFAGEAELFVCYLLSRSVHGGMVSIRSQNPARGIARSLIRRRRWTYPAPLEPHITVRAGVPRIRWAWPPRGQSVRNVSVGPLAPKVPTTAQIRSSLGSSAPKEPLARRMLSAA